MRRLLALALAAVFGLALPAGAAPADYHDMGNPVASYHDLRDYHDLGVGRLA
jgi:hypothetical protein